MKPHLLVFAVQLNGKGIDGLVVPADLLTRSTLLPQPDALNIGERVKNQARRTGHTVLSKVDLNSETAEALELASTKLFQLHNAGKIDALTLHNVKPSLIAAMYETDSEIATRTRFVGAPTKDIEAIRNSFRSIVETELDGATAGKGLNPREVKVFRRGATHDFLRLSHNIGSHSKTIGRIEAEIDLRATDFSSLHLTLTDRDGKVILDTTNNNLPNALHAQIDPRQDAPRIVSLEIGTLLLESRRAAAMDQSSSAQNWMMQNESSLIELVDNLAIERATAQSLPF